MRPKLLVHQRRRLITEMVERNGQATVNELARKFTLSEVTVRTDLEALARSGAVLRSHGGALRRRENDEVPIAVKQIQQHDEKVRIAKAALQFIRDGDVIILDSGSTTAEIAQLLQTAQLSKLTVITNALNIAMLLAHVPHVHLIMLGGELRKMSFSLAGLHAEQALEHLQADTLFLGVDSIHTEVGLMTPHVHEAQLNKKMIASSRQIIAVADSTKFQMRSLSVICKLEQVHTLITDDKLDAKIGKDITKAGVRLIKA